MQWLSVVVESIFFGFLILLAASAVGAGLGKYLSTRRDQPKLKRPRSPRYEFRRAQDYQKRLDRLTRRIEREARTAATRFAKGPGPMSGQTQPCKHSDLRIYVAHYWPVDVDGEALVGDPRGEECEDINPR